MTIKIFLFTFILMRVLRVSSLSEEQSFYKIQKDNSVNVKISKQVYFTDADEFCKSYNETATNCPKEKCVLGYISYCDPLDGKCVYPKNCEDEFGGIFIAVFFLLCFLVCFLIFLMTAGLIYRRDDDLEMGIGRVQNTTEPVIYPSQNLEKLNVNNLNNIKKYKLKSFNSIEDNTIFDESLINNNQTALMKNINIKNMNFPVYLREFDTEKIINEPLYDKIILDHNNNLNQAHSEKLQNNYHCI